jgi:hypothetical protein
MEQELSNKPARECHMRLQKVDVSRSDGFRDFKIAALAIQRGQNLLLLCTPHAKSWIVCSADFITIGSDVDFFQDKLFILGSNQEELCAIEFGPHFCLFPAVMRVCRCAAVGPPLVNNTQ